MWLEPEQASEAGAATARLAVPPQELASFPIPPSLLALTDPRSHRPAGFTSSLSRGRPSPLFPVYIHSLSPGFIGQTSDLVKTSRPTAASKVDMLVSVNAQLLLCLPSHQPLCWPWDNSDYSPWVFPAHPVYYALLCLPHPAPVVGCPVLIKSSIWSLGRTPEVYLFLIPVSLVVFPGSLSQTRAFRLPGDQPHSHHL